jgi:hypothetical protein
MTVSSCLEVSLSQTAGDRIDILFYKGEIFKGQFRLRIV